MPAIAARALPARADRPAAPRARGAASWLDAGHFVGAVMFICLVLQRFALPIGSLEMSLATPLMLLLTVLAVLKGVLTLERRRTALFCGLCAVAVLATAKQMNDPVAFAPRTSTNSLLYWLLITGFAVFRLREKMDERRFFAIVNGWLLFLAGAGVLQFVAQFGGLRLFSFRGFVPWQFLIEQQYAVVIPLGVGDIIRGNGLFLVEPSVFSQFMAIGIIIEWLYFRRPLALALLFAGLLAAISGTGWLILAAFMVQTVLTSGSRDAMRAIGFALVCGVAVVIASFVAPEVTNSLFGRVGELSQTGSSGYARFVTPFMALGQVLHDAPDVFFTGLGPGAATELTLAFKYWLNTPVKVLMEYGVFGLGCYLGLLLVAARSAGQTRLVLPLLVLLMFTGGYQEFSPILFPVLLISAVAFLRAPVPQSGTQTQRLRGGFRPNSGSTHQTFTTC